jgi:3'(2'), 5'-bisphosphate nucleotidase
VSRYSAIELKALAEAVVPIARRAGADIMAIYGGAFDVEQKSDCTPLTAADMASHRRLEAELAPLDPGALVLSEEAAPERFAVRRQARRIWLVDPLDGTREFVKRNGEFCVNVALVEDGDVRLGLLLHPPSGTIWCAWDGGGAYRVDADGWTPIHVTKPSPVPPRAAASRSFGSPVVECYLATLGPIERCAQGSALKFARIAQGECDIYARLASRCSEWDVAAGHCIVVEAGGQVVDPHGEPLRYNQRDTLIMHHFLAYGDADRPWLEHLHGIDLND